MKKLLFTAILSMIIALCWAQNAIRVEVKGKGQPTIFLPGFGCSGSVWNETVAELERRAECHVVTYAGFDGVPAVDTLWMKKVEESIAEYIISKKLKNVVVVGHSIGGTFGLMLSTKPQLSISKLVVVDMLPCIGMVMIPNYKPEYVTFDNPYNKRLLAMGEQEFSTMQKQMAANMCADTAAQRRIVGWMLKADRKTYVYGYTELMKLDLRESLKSIETPTLILSAGRYPSKEQVITMYNEQYVGLKHKSIKHIDGSAHFVMFDQPKTLISELKGFIFNE